MKLNKSKLKQIIKEELQTTLLEDWGDDSGCGETSCEQMNDDIDMLQDQIEYLKNIIRDLGGTVPG